MFGEYQTMDTVTHGIGFKAVHKLNGKYVSPTDHEFVWDKEGIATAVCQRQAPYDWDRDVGRVSYVPGTSWHADADTPHEDCTCGLYAAFGFGDATLYERRAPQAILLVVEAAGPTIYYDLGFRAQQCKVRAVVGNIKRLSDDVACQYFQVPWFTLDVAKTLLDIQNYRVSRQVKEPWDYSPFYLKEKDVIKAVEKLPPLDWLEVDDPTDGIAIEWPFK